MQTNLLLQELSQQELDNLPLCLRAIQPVPINESSKNMAFLLAYSSSLEGFFFVPNSYYKPIARYLQKFPHFNHESSI